MFRRYPGHAPIATGIRYPTKRASAFRLSRIRFRGFCAISELSPRLRTVTASLAPRGSRFSPGSTRNSFREFRKTRPTRVDLDLTSLYPIPDACEGSLLCLLAASVPEGSALYHFVLRSVNRLDGFFSLFRRTLQEPTGATADSAATRAQNPAPTIPRPSLVSDFSETRCFPLARRF